MSLTINQFRQDPVRVDAARKILADPTLMEMLAVLRDDGPEMKPREVGLTPTDANVRLGYIHGYAAHHLNFELLGERLPRPIEQPPPPYEPPDEAEE